MNTNNNNADTRRILDLCDDALERAEAERAAFLDAACDGDEALRRSVDSVLLAIGASDGMLQSESLLDADSSAMLGRTIGNYKIESLLGEGGMGTVFLATRQHDDVAQRVAIKIIRGRFVGTEMIARFQAEHKMLARLNHPYIASLIDGGTSSDGVPYLVMEYVEGVPVDQWLDEQQVDIAGRIEMIRKIALAVHAAHQNLIVHRDLKPSNVLVTADGIPKLLDFGIAKLITVDDDADAGCTTVFGGQALTPDYASPEQILENRVTTSSDVFSLGVLSYQLLTGLRPYHIDRSTRQDLVGAVDELSVPRASTRLDTTDSPATANQIASTRCTTPERLKKMLAGDLDNILAKALAREPGDRYVSVDAFSTDLGRYLDGVPVEARAATLGYRLSRFISRNRLSVSLAATAVVLLIAGLSASTWSYLRAETARQAAAERFEQVRTLAGKMMFDVYDDIEKVPGTTSARQTLANTAQDYLATLADSPNAPADVILEAAQGFARLATILDRTAVANPDDRVAATAARERAYAMLDDLVNSDPGNAIAYHTHGQLLSNHAANLTYVTNDPVAARTVLDEALAKLDTAQSLEPNSATIAADRLIALERSAETYKWQNDYATTRDRAIDLIAEIEIAEGNWLTEAAFPKAKGDSYQLLGEAHYFLDDYDEAIAAYGNSIDAYRHALTVGGADQAISDALSIAHWSRGNSYIDTDRPALASPEYATAIELIQEVVARDPNDSTAARRLAILRGSNAMALVQQGDKAAAVAEMTKTNDWFESQAAAEPDTPGAQRSLAVSYHMMGDIYHYAEDPQQACHWYGETLKLWDVIDARFGIADFDSEQPALLRELLKDCD